MAGNDSRSTLVSILLLLLLAHLGVGLLLDLLNPLEVLSNGLAVLAAPAGAVQLATNGAQQLGQDLHIFVAL